MLISLCSVNNPFQNIRAMFETPQTETCKPPASTSLYDYNASFFSPVASALRQIHEAGHGAVKIEAIAGDAFRVMDQVINLRLVCPGPIHLTAGPDLVRITRTSRRVSNSI
jgi:hypothetical protein